MDYTKNLKLSKPSYEDDVDIQVINTNMDIIDNNINNIDLAPYALKKDYLPLVGGNITGDLTIKQNQVKYVVNSWRSDDGRQYWIKYSDGELVQVAEIDQRDSGTFNNKRLTLLTPFIDNTYFVILLCETTKSRRPTDNYNYNNSIVGTGATGTTTEIQDKTTTAVTVCVDITSLNRVMCIGRWK